MLRQATTVFVVVVVVMMSSAKMVNAGAVPIDELSQYETTPLPVSGPDDTTGIAVSEGLYATTDAFEDEFEVRELTPPYTVVANIPLRDLQYLHGVPLGSTSDGPDGMSSVTALNGWWYVVAVTDRSDDAIYKIPLDGDISNSEVFATPIIHNRGDRPFNRSEIEFLSPDILVLGTSFDLTVLNGTGTDVGTIGPRDNFDGVAIIDSALIVITRGGKLMADFNLQDADPSVVQLIELVGDPITDLSAGTFGSIGRALFVGTTTGDVRLLAA